MTVDADIIATAKRWVSTLPRDQFDLVRALISRGHDNGFIAGALALRGVALEHAKSRGATAVYDAIAEIHPANLKDRT